MGILSILGGAPLTEIECFNFYKLEGDAEFLTTSMKEDAEARKDKLTPSNAREKRVGTIPLIEDQRTIKDFFVRHGLPFKVHPHPPASI